MYEYESGHIKVSNHWFTTHEAEVVREILASGGRVPEALVTLFLIGVNHTAWGTFTKRVKGQDVTLERGELLLSYGLLEQLYGWKRHQARAFVEARVADGFMIEMRSEGNAGTVYRLTRYEEIQGQQAALFSRTPRRTQGRIPAAPQKGVTATTYEDGLHPFHMPDRTPSLTTINKQRKNKQNKQAGSFELQSGEGPAASTSCTASVPVDAVATVFEVCVAAHAGRTGAEMSPLRLTSRNESSIRARLSEGFTTDQLAAAGRGLYADTWEERDLYLDPFYAFRDAAAVQRFMALDPGSDADASDWKKRGLRFLAQVSAA